MLFDLRGRGRRRTVRTVYIGLALLFALGFVGFGVGGGFGGGGILTSLNGHEGSGGASYSAEVKKYEKLTRTQPGNVAAWEKLTTALLHEAGGEAYSTRTGVTSKGKELVARAARAWRGYLALNPPHPNLTLAKEIVRIFGEEGLNEPSAAQQVLQIIVAAEPKNTVYYRFLAEEAYKAKNTRVGDLAAAKAVSLAPAAERKQLKLALAALKKNPSGSGEVLTATTNGKTYTVSPAGNGTYTGAVPTSTAPAGTSSTKKK
jgi:hypothetical protein